MTRMKQRIVDAIRGQGTRVFLNGAEVRFEPGSLRVDHIRARPSIVYVYSRGAVREFYQSGVPVRTPGFWHSFDVQYHFKLKPLGETHEQAKAAGAVAAGGDAVQGGAGPRQSL